MSNERKNKGNNEKMYLMKSIYDSLNDEWNFQVKNSTKYDYTNIDNDRYYKIKINSQKAQCTCMDYKMRRYKENLPCKHLYFIINRVCGNLGYEKLTIISQNYQQFKERIEKRIKDVLENKSKETNIEDETHNINDLLLQICKEEEYCSICYDNFDYENINANNVKICISQCKKPYHVECIRMWLARHNTCPLCRSNWIKENTKDIPCDPFCHLNENTIKI
jgi:hypothetical protein